MKQIQTRQLLPFQYQKSVINHNALGKAFYTGDSGSKGELTSQGACAGCITDRTP